MNQYTINAGSSLQMTATLRSLDGSGRDATKTSFWTSSDTDVATVQTLGDTNPGRVSVPGQATSTEDVGVYTLDGAPYIKGAEIEPSAPNDYHLYFDVGVNRLPYWIAFPTVALQTVSNAWLIPHPGVDVQVAQHIGFSDVDVVTDMSDQPITMLWEVSGSSNVLYIESLGLYIWYGGPNTIGPFSIRVCDELINEQYTMSASFYIHNAQDF